MKINIGTADRLARFLAGILAIGIGYYFSNWWGAVGLVFIFTSFFSWCPAYSLMKINTLSKPQKPAEQK